MKLTTKLGLKKPDLADYVNIGDLNDNMDVLDVKVGSLKEGTTEVTDLETVDKTYKGAINEINQKVKTHKAETIHQGKHTTIEATSTTNATSVINAPLKTSGGLAVAKDSFFGGTANYSNGIIGDIKGLKMSGFGIFNLTPPIIEAAKRLVVILEYSNPTQVGGLQVISGYSSNSVSGGRSYVDKLFAFNLVYNALTGVVTDTRLIKDWKDTDISISAIGTSNRIKLTINHHGTIAHTLDGTRSLTLIGTGSAQLQLIDMYTENIS